MFVIAILKSGTHDVNSLGAGLSNLDAQRQDAFEMASGPRDIGNLEVASEAGRLHA